MTLDRLNVDSRPDDRIRMYGRGVRNQTASDPSSHNDATATGSVLHGLLPIAVHGQLTVRTGGRYNVAIFLLAQEKFVNSVTPLTFTTRFSSPNSRSPRQCPSLCHPASLRSSTLR